ncbi:MAG: hypothetical protein E6H64_14080 [Betaproteobacteria bacterium]|nr:MAG: hypothetical protein E6H64_14080 [Betaproteobacteria bacterium]
MRRYPTSTSTVAGMYFRQNQPMKAPLARADRPVADISHHARIAVQAMEILRVARMELAQREPLRREQRLAGGTRRHSARLP